MTRYTFQESKIYADGELVAIAINNHLAAGMADWLNERRDKDVVIAGFRTNLAAVNKTCDQLREEMYATNVALEHTRKRSNERRTQVLELQRELATISDQLVRDYLTGLHKWLQAEFGRTETVPTLPWAGK